MRKILVADDDPLIRRLALNSLASQEFEVYDADNGEQCLEKAREVQPDLILLDTRMPRLCGPPLSEALVQSCPQAKLVLLVGQGPEDEPAAACLKRAHERMDKPFSPLGLIRMVHRQLGAVPSTMDSGEQPRALHDLERQQLLLYARDLARLRREDFRKTQELREAKRRLEQLEKDKDMFLALVSHELRTPLTIIKGHARLLTRVLGQDPKQAKLLEFAGALVGASDRLEKLILEMLSYSGMRTGLAPFEPQEADLQQVLGSLVNELQPLARSREVALEFASGPPLLLKTDRPRLQEAFSHLLKNAILFNRVGGKAVVSCQEIDQGARVVIADTGVGMAPEERNKVFLPFYQAQDVLTRQVEGLGLGLAITRHIIETHGGTIELESELDQGTLVKVFLPRVPPDQDLVPPAPNQPPPPDSHRGERQLLDYARELYAAYDLERTRRLHSEEMHRELERTFVETLATLMRAVDAHADHAVPLSVGRGMDVAHLDRVSYYATELALRIDPELANKRDFRYALLLHDVGKIGVAESLLKKVGQLTREEQDMLHAHSSIGAELLQSIDFLHPALEGVRHHHERWDGHGYPDGLKGTEIPLAARIIAVADSFDAMTVDRPYRKALPLEKARQELIKEAGAQFDPGVVKAFEGMWERIARFAREHLPKG